MYGSNFNVSTMGVTQISVGLSATIQVKAGARQNQWLFKKFSGGSLAVVSGASAISSSGYMMGDTEVMEIDGAATFYLAAAGSAVVVHMLIGQTAGS